MEQSEDLGRAQTPEPSALLGGDICVTRAAFQNSNTEMSTVQAFCWVTVGNSLPLSEHQFLVPSLLK